MPRMNNEAYRIVNLFDWTGGIRDKRQNPLVYPENAFMSGENVDLVNGGLKTRRGSSPAFLSALREPAAVALTADPTGGDYAIRGHAAAYDPDDHTMFIFGGFVGGRPDYRLRRYLIELDEWQIIDVPGDRPSARAYHSLIYDPLNRSLWVIGGCSETEVFGDIWSYDIEGNAWSRITPSGAPLTARQEHTAVYDPIGHAVFVFGGISGATYRSDLWRYDIGVGAGAFLSPSGSLPSARYGHAAAYNPGDRSMLVFCGYSENENAPVADLWKYDLERNSWTQIRGIDGGAVPHPEPVFGHVAVYFEEREAFVVHGGFGGALQTGGPGEDTFRLYDAVADRFEVMTIQGEGISDNPLAHHSAVYDAVCRGIIIVGGVGTNETWGFGFGGPCGYTSAGDPVGEFLALTQVRFPTNEVGYLLAQMKYGGVNRLYAAYDALPATGGSGRFLELFDLGSGAGTCSFAVLNDRAVITEGVNHAPLVFAGCLDSSGADWAVPKAVIVTHDDGASWHDITGPVCDRDPETYGDISSLSASGGRVLICTDMSGVRGFSFEMASPNSMDGSMTVRGYSGQWSEGLGWIDNTGGLHLNGTVMHVGDVFSASYHVVNNVPGFWFSLEWPSGTSANTHVSRILFRAPCQHLQVIGEGRPDTPLGFIYWDASENSAKDFTVEVSDDTYPSFARLNDGQLESPIGMGAADALYIGYLTAFNGVDLTPHNDYRNQAAAELSGAYWNGTTWQSLPGFSDGTVKPSGTTLGIKGRLSWNTPSNWRQCRPVGPDYPHGYWVKLTVSASLTAKTYVSEAKIWPVLEPLKKHRFALTVRDRMVLINRPDAPDQADVSRAYEEYGFAGTDSASQRIGGQDAVVAAHTVFNQGFIAKTEDWYLFNGYSPETFSFERAEAAGQAPINNQVVVRAPLTEADSKNLMGLYYLNRTGAWYFAGIKVYKLSEDVSWWDDGTAPPRLDLLYLHKACGVYWPERNWIIWSVPMIVSGSEQPTNNRLIIYDLTLRTWLPPFTMSLASLTTAYHGNADAPGKLGQLGLYGGTYSGSVLRLFGPDDGTDDGNPIVAWVETGWLHFGSPQWHKVIRRLQLYGRTSAGRDIKLKIWTDGGRDVGNPAATISVADLDMLSAKLFGLEEENVNTQGRFFKFRIEFTDVTDVFGIQLGVSLVREWGAT